MPFRRQKVLVVDTTYTFICTIDKSSSDFLCNGLFSIFLAKNVLPTFVGTTSNIKVNFEDTLLEDM